MCLFAFVCLYVCVRRLCVCLRLSVCMCVCGEGGAVVDDRGILMAKV